MNQILEQIFSQLRHLSNDELLHLRDEIDDFLENQDNDESVIDESPQVSNKRITMPRIGKLVDWGTVKVGDRLHVKDHGDQPATIISRKAVEFNGEQMSVWKWATQVTGWKAISIYGWVILERENRLLWEVRRDAMIERGMDFPYEG